MLVFVFLHRFVADDIQRRSDAWLSGEVEVLGDVAERTPKDALYGRVVGEVAELAGKEVPNKLTAESSSNDSVFFLQTGGDGSLKLWVGAGSGEPNLKAIQASRIVPDQADGSACPGVRGSLSRGFDRASTMEVTSILGFSERDELRVLRNLRLRFFLFWLLLVLFGFGIVFFTTRRMLSHVREITEAASRIGHSDLERQGADNRAKRRSRPPGFDSEPHARPHREFDAPVAHHHGFAGA